ncbi:MAG: 16S rRNA (cytosine(1402)-N(4))-methyltransferase RsmH [Pelagibacterales bacterium]|nr:16S rRNA (cytosine(1402)-N(4))-methyltransferase RsmH [Pelagibacterales bacterium]MBT7076468.1 16S rRNA (cytosine(1402)-N(4))-methyltransferase RsmH [Pelagibacterales bacterium]
MKNSHIPVLADEVAKNLNIRNGLTYVDGTYGAGGHTEMILSSANCNVVSIDRDPSVKIYADKTKNKYPNNFKLITGNIGRLKFLLESNGIENIDGGILFDLGVSSMQIDNAKRGFSFRYDGPLDMRMENSGKSAAEIINESDEKTLNDIIFTLGEERKARRIANAIVHYRKNKLITTTFELAQIVRSAIGKNPKLKIDPATKTFQALRIKVNNELTEIEKALNDAEDLLSPGARLVVICFHSLEDKIVKNFIKVRSGFTPNPHRHSASIYSSLDKEKPSFKQITKKVVIADNKEIYINSRSRSAKLRAAERLNNMENAA